MEDTRRIVSKRKDGHAIHVHVEDAVYSWIVALAEEGERSITRQTALLLRRMYTDTLPAKPQSPPSKKRTRRGTNA